MKDMRGFPRAPNVSAFLSEDSTAIGLALKLRAELFHFPNSQFTDGDLRELSWVLLASQIMYYETCSKSYGVNHPIVFAMTNAINRVHGLSVSTVKSWGAKIRQQWTDANALVSAEDNEVKNVYMAVRLNGIEEELKQTKELIRRLADSVEKKMDDTNT